MSRHSGPPRYAVIGHPITHSRSPFIHGRFATQVGHAMSYEAVDVAPAGFAEQVDALCAQGFRGLNVTVPLKGLAFDYALKRSARAQRAGAVNTLAFEVDGTVFGDNTDGVGLCRDLGTNLGWPIAGQRVLMLGAGGAARGVLGPLLEAEPLELVVANRTRQRAAELVALFSDGDPPLAHAGLEEIGGGGFHLVINATSASLAGDDLSLPASVFAQDARAYDMMYAPVHTPFLAWAHSAGVAHLSDGRGMLVEQAAESFFLWRGVRPRTAPVIAALSALLGGK